jgi:NADP-dependent 3-hydroxy acid dehydrogenase YdfG
MSLDQLDKVVAVTGASSGIGEAIARELTDAGCRVMLAARQESQLKSLVQELGDRTAYHLTDVTNAQSVQEMAQATIDRFGKIDVLVNSELMQSSNDEKTINQITSKFSDVSFISPTAISRAVHYAIAQPPEVAVNEIIVRPANQEL